MANFVLKGGLYIEKAATDLMVSFDAEEMMANGYMRPVIWPRRPSDQLSGIIRQLDIDDMLRVYNPETSLVGADQLIEADFKLDADLTFKLRAFGMEGVIDYVEQAAADPVIDYASEKTQATIFKFFTSLEKISFDTLRDPAQVPNGRNLVAAERLDNYGSAQSNPIVQLSYARQFLTQDLGNAPTFALMDEMVWDWGFEKHPYLISRAPVHVAPGVAGSGAQPLPEVIERLSGLNAGVLKKYTRRYNTRRDGETTGALRRSFLGSDILVGFSQPASIRSAGFGYEMAFTGLSDLPSDTPFAVLTYEDPKRGLFGSQRVRVVTIIGWIITRTRSIYRITGTVDLTDTAKYFYLGSAVLD